MKTKIFICVVSLIDRFDGGVRFGRKTRERITRRLITKRKIKRLKKRMRKKRNLRAT